MPQELLECLLAALKHSNQFGDALSFELTPTNILRAPYEVFIYSQFIL